MKMVEVCNKTNRAIEPTLLHYTRSPVQPNSYVRLPLCYPTLYISSSFFLFFGANVDTHTLVVLLNIIFYIALWFILDYYALALFLVYSVLLQLPME